MKIRIAVAAFTVMTLTSADLRAQDTAGALAAVEQMFEGMRTADSDMVRAVFASDARFAMVDSGQGPAAVRFQSVDGWIEAIGRSEGSWNEQIYDVEVLADGNMAVVWAPYTFYLDGRISHCGINSIAMLHDGAGWKVTQISDTRAAENCPDPLGL
ncbi:MAG: nuclear transport factor 2 family protein [Gemmatimonadota bacterium]|nr:nuclear transport factor 2 family protein [Gemmatimonadota bacterium]